MDRNAALGWLWRTELPGWGPSSHGLLPPWYRAVQTFLRIVGGSVGSKGDWGEGCGEEACPLQMATTKDKQIQSLIPPLIFPKWPMKSAYYMRISIYFYNLLALGLMANKETPCTPPDMSAHLLHGPWSPPGAWWACEGQNSLSVWYFWGQIRSVQTTSMRLANGQQQAKVDGTASPWPAS